jgi:hypothetical protein
MHLRRQREPSPGAADMCVTTLQSTVAKPEVLLAVLREELGKDSFTLDVRSSVTFLLPPLPLFFLLGGGRRYDTGGLDSVQDTSVWVLTVLGGSYGTISFGSRTTSSSTRYMFFSIQTHAGPLCR